MDSATFLFVLACSFIFLSFFLNCILYFPPYSILPIIFSAPPPQLLRASPKPRQVRGFIYLENWDLEALSVMMAQRRRLRSLMSYFVPWFPSGGLPDERG